MKRDIVDYFQDLVMIDSESGFERKIADKVIQDLRELGADVIEEDRGSTEAGNIYAYFQGSPDKKPIMFCAHIDTVKPGNGVKPRIVNGKITSDGTTILGADDKSGVAQIILGIADILTEVTAHAPIEVVLTVKEEIGLQGAKALDKSRLKSAFGYALDAQDIGDIIIGAPSQNSIKIVVRGKEAHAGVEPEKGISAIRVAAEAITMMPLGRIDHETTANLGIISGGIATNIVAKQVEIMGEARSHNPLKLDQVCSDITKALEHAINKHQHENMKASFEIAINREYSAFYVHEDEMPVALLKAAMAQLNIIPKVQKGGGGSDANIFNAGGVQVVIIGTGMNRYHTVEEYITIEELKRGQALVSELIRQYSRVD
ncbi:MAG: peptidase T [Candidatus Cloacimonetes bacterium HGW-Cloacimonetes-1]|nr:MAG: peptidase T [Candidatus Cloacimonetes bacterium HGW-Cloacimonetes-1]